MSRWEAKSSVKGVGLTEVSDKKLDSKSAGEVRGISRVVVKYVVIRKNTSGEGGLMDCKRR